MILLLGMLCLAIQADGVSDSRLLEPVRSSQPKVSHGRGPMWDGNERDPYRKGFKNTLLQQDDVRVSTSGMEVPFGSLSQRITMIRNAVVQVLSLRTEFNWQTPWASGPSGNFAGSGFFVKLSGRTFIVTNAHVVAQTVQLAITLPALGDEQFEVQIWAICHNKDIALLTFTPDANDKLRSMLDHAKIDDVAFLPIGNSDDALQGSMAIVVGYPLGQANIKVATGIISGMEHADGVFYIQTTAPINHGNSGGPLLNEAGEVVGINSAVLEGSENCGLALPMNHIIHLLENFAGVRPDSSADIVRKAPVIGVALDPVSPELYDFIGLPDGHGARVRQVAPRGLFHDMGVQAGDIVLSYLGYQLDRFGDALPEGSLENMNLFDLTERQKIGSTISVTVWRDGKEMTLSTQLGFNSQAHTYPVRYFEEPALENLPYEIFAGLVFMDLTLNHIGMSDFSNSNPRLDDYYWDINKYSERRVIISAVLSDTFVPEGTVQPGDLVAKINGHDIMSLADFAAAFVPHTQRGGKRFWTLETDSGSQLVVDFDAMLAREEVLASIYHYDVTPGVLHSIAASTSKDTTEFVAPPFLASTTITTTPGSPSQTTHHTKSKAQRSDAANADAVEGGAASADNGVSGGSMGAAGIAVLKRIQQSFQ